MKRLSVFLFTVAFLQPGALHARTHASKPAPATTVAAAVSFCRAHPSSVKHIAVQGWFVRGATYNALVQGLLFDSRRAVPLVAVDRWDVNGNWKKYGALLTFITTRSSFGSRRLTLHGVLTCATFQFRTDRDPFPPPRLKTAYGTSRSGQSQTTWAVAGGLKLTLTVPRRTYSRDALAQVSVNLQNVSSHVVGYLVPGVDLPGVTAPQVEVLDSSGRIVFPPAMPFMPALPGPAPFMQPLRPGQTVRAMNFIVVRGARIRASQPFTLTLSQNMQRPPNELVTRPIGVQLTAESAPKLALRGAAQHPTIDVMRPAGASGQMLVLSYADCSGSGGSSDYAYNSNWAPSGPHVIPGCSPVHVWHVRVAWPTHPVAVLDYNAPQAATPTPAPTSTPVPTPTSSPGKFGPAFGDLLHRADVAMVSAHSMHIDGIRTSVDTSSNMSLRIHADCRSQAGHGTPIVSQTLVSGRQSGAGRIDEGYIVAGPIVPQPNATPRVWQRSQVQGQRWRLVDPYSQWGVGRSLPDPTFDFDPAYLGQICPDLVRPTYLSSPLPGMQYRVLGTEMLGGRLVWHLHEQLWFKLDLYVDAHSFRLRRLLFWDGGSHAQSHWRVGFDYSEPARAIHIPVSPASANLTPSHPTPRR